MRLTRNSVVALFVAVTAIVAGCNRHEVLYSHYEPIDAEGWNREDGAVFNLSSVPDRGCYAIETGLRTYSTYPFRNLSLVVRIMAVPSGLERNDTLNVLLADEEGNTLGQGVSHYQYNFGLPDMNLQAGDSLHIVVTHNMRRLSLPGISDVGITIKKTEN